MILPRDLYNMKLTLYIVRHGQTIDNIEHRIQGHTDSPLTQLGIQQAQAIARRLADERFAAIYSSDLGRAAQTAQVIVNAQNPQQQINATALLRELHLGLAQGLTRKEYEQKRPQEYALWISDSVKHRPAQAESIADAVNRASGFIESVLNKHDDGDKLCVVAHGGSIRAMLISALDLPHDCHRKLSTSNTGLTILEVGDNPRLRLCNDTSHLDAAS